MDNNFIISADIATNSNDDQLGLEIWLDDKLLQDIVPTAESTTISINANDNDECQHNLKFILKNKTSDHTKVDSEGNIIKDTTITIENLKFDGIELGNIIYALAEYTHNFNGTGPEVVEKFYGTMGCNGTVSLKFSTPFYLWLLEAM